jgi:DNA-binding transcriptional LysR family regulator
VTLQLHERESPEIGAALASGDLDIAIVRGPFKHEGVTSELLIREPLALALPSTHRRARERAIALSSLAAEPFVLFPRHTAPGLHDAVMSMCVAAGFSPVVVQEAPSWSSVVCFVAAGLGITIAPLSAGDLRPRTVVFRELRGASGWAELAIAFKERELSPIAAQFRAIAHAGAPRGGSSPKVIKRGASRSRRER